MAEEQPADLTNLMTNDFVELAGRASGGRLPPRTDVEQAEWMRNWAIKHRDQLPDIVEPTEELGEEESESPPTLAIQAARDAIGAAVVGSFEPARLMLMRIEIYRQDVERFHSHQDETGTVDEPLEDYADLEEKKAILFALQTPEDHGFSLEDQLRNLIPLPVEQGLRIHQAPAHITNEEALQTPGYTITELCEQALQAGDRGERHPLVSVLGLITTVYDELDSLLGLSPDDENSIHRSAEARTEYHRWCGARAELEVEDEHGNTLEARVGEAWRLLMTVATQPVAAHNPQRVYTDEELENITQSLPVVPITPCHVRLQRHEHSRRIVGELLGNICPICRLEFEKPAFSPCGHVFCAKCAIPPMWNTRRCPTCR